MFGLPPAAVPLLRKVLERPQSRHSEFAPRTLAALKNARFEFEAPINEGEAIFRKLAERGGKHTSERPGNCSRPKTRSWNVWRSPTVTRMRSQLPFAARDGWTIRKP